MKFGTKVYLYRGGHKSPSPGQFRFVKATYIGAFGNHVECRLEQDDPDATSWRNKGDIGFWSRSIMFEKIKKI